MTPHWSVQVLLGPSLTFRRLAAPQYESGLLAMSSPVAGGLPANALSRSTSNVADVERPALAPGGQVQFRRNLNGRWALAGGLGYRQYVSALSVNMYQATSRLSPTATSYVITDSLLVGTIRRRDTYHYFTVPVQASYALGVGGRRWRTAVLAGAELGVYVGGATSEGPPCNCAARTWSPTGSPYRTLSLALSLGLDVRYRLGAPGSSTWELLAQPTATYGLTSLARTGSGYYARYPYTTGLLLGVSHDLR